jgi:hypothetical protein
MFRSSPVRDAPVDRIISRVILLAQASLAVPCSEVMLPCMFLVSEADAAAIRAIYEQDGELSAAIELRRRFLGITDNAKARECVRSIAGWKPLPSMPAKVVRLRTGRTE